MTIFPADRARRKDSRSSLALRRQIIGVRAGDSGVDDGVLGLVQGVEREVDSVGRVLLCRIGAVLDALVVVFRAVLVGVGAHGGEVAVHRGVRRSCHFESTAALASAACWLTLARRASTADVSAAF